jgi:hypothetical protein
MFILPVHALKLVFDNHQFIYVNFLLRKWMFEINLHFRQRMFVCLVWLAV